MSLVYSRNNIVRAEKPLGSNRRSAFNLSAKGKTGADCSDDADDVVGDVGKICCATLL